MAIDRFRQGRLNMMLATGVSVGKRMTLIMIVDDDEGMRVALDKRLAERGYSVETAANGLHAMQRLRAGIVPDFIVTDIKMSGLNGFKFIEKLHEEFPQYRDRVVVISGHAGAAEVKEAKHLGISKLFVKPFRTEELIRYIEYARTPENPSSDEPSN